MVEKSSKQTSPVVSLVSGGIAGGVEAAATYPFEFAKTRVQLRNENPQVVFSRNPYRIVGQIYREEGLRAMYKGCSTLVVGSIGKDAIRFLSFDTIKNTFADPETGAMTPLRNMLAGMTAGVVASITAVTPTERIKTALIDDARHDKRFISPIHAVRTIIQEDGLKGIYRGFAGTTLKQASATSVRMGVYNIVKEFERARGISQTTVMNFANGAVAGTITVFATQPFDTIKTRSQSAKATTTMQAVTSVMTEYGVRGFWRGSVMRLSRTVFSGGILFTTAEAVAKIMNPMLGRPSS